MSQTEEEETPSGGSAPGDTIDLASESSSVVPDFFSESFAGKAVNFFSATSDNVGIGLADKGENGEEEEARAVLPVDEEGFVPRVVEDFDVKEAAMAETLINGLHLVEHGGGVLAAVPTEDRDQRTIVAAEQRAVARDQHSDETEWVGSPHQKRNQSSGLPVEHHRRPPISGSQGGGTQDQKSAGGPEGHSSRPPGSQGGGTQDRRSSDGPEGNSSRPAGGTNIAGGRNIVGDVVYNIASEDEEGRSRQRILTFAAKRYSTAVERNPSDHDALYNWALVLQESADNTDPEAGNAGKDGLLEEACRKYEAATELCPTLHEAFYNWAIAISDRAKIRGRTKEAEELWKQACERYDKSVQLNWNSPQALNNWGLALQELGAIVPLKEKRAIVKKAIRKFRLAIRLRFDFHRAVYNLGTVLYGLAEDTLRGGRKLSVREPTPTDLYSQSAIYIAAAHALKPDYPVYRSALRLVRSMLPLPYVKAGYLTIPPIGDSLAPHSDWQRMWFVLDHEALHEMEKLDSKSLSKSTSRRSSGIGESSSQSASSRPSMLRIEMEDIVWMAPCADLSLPPGGACRIDTLTGHQFLIADTWEAIDGWIDAIRLVYTIFARGKRDSLAGVLAG